MKWLKKRKADEAPAMNPFDLSFSSTPPPDENDAYWQPSGGIGSRRADEAEAAYQLALERRLQVEAEEREAQAIADRDRYRPPDIDAANLR